MPRTAATMFGMVLVALSIGFNTVRWPIVGRMVGPAEGPTLPGESTVPPATPEQPANPAAAQPASPAPTAPVAAPAVKPLPDVDKTAGDDRPAIPLEQPADFAPTAGENPSSASIRQQTPLVPVPRTRTSTEPAAGIEYDGTVRRLPPVDPSEPPPVSGNRPSSDGALPVYPSTGIE